MPCSQLEVILCFGGIYGLYALLAACFMQEAWLPLQPRSLESTCSFEKSVDLQPSTQRYIPVNRTLHNHLCDNLKCEHTRCIGKFPDCYCCNCLGEIRWEAKVILPQAYCITLPRDIALWTSIVFTRVLIRLRVSFCLRWIAKSSNVSAFSFLHVVQTGSEAHPASYPIGTGGSFPGGKAAGAWSWALTN
jgi:hypothetical protein